jgi:antitoxin MazE
MTATVQKWGNSLAIRIPRTVAKDIHIQQGSLVEISASSGNLLVSPTRRRKRGLARLLAGVTRSNLHSAIDWGDPVGREIW